MTTQKPSQTVHQQRTGGTFPTAKNPHRERASGTGLGRKKTAGVIKAPTTGKNPHKQGVRGSIS